MTVWQYAHLYFHVTAVASEDVQPQILRELDTLGRDGWELVSVVPMPAVNALAYYFKRLL